MNFCEIVTKDLQILKISKLIDLCKKSKNSENVFLQIFILKVNRKVFKNIFLKI